MFNAFDKHNAKQKTFKLDEEGKPSRVISIADYFREKYKITLKFPDLPCIIVGQKGNVLPIEVCVLAPNQKVNRNKLTPDQEANMIKSCALRPPDRMAAIKKVHQEQDYATDPFLAGCGME